ncbi:MAG: response regulator, partial [Actinomycetes bacterium]
MEDDPGMVRVLRRGLTEEGYAVDSCGDGHESVWRAVEMGYDAVVLDVMLPG